MPADWVTGYSPVAGIRLHAVSPPAVVPLASSVMSTTIGDRDIPGTPRRDSRLVWPALRAQVGRLLLRLRKLGVRPASYVKRL